MSNERMTVCEKNKCTGCMACIEVCNKGALSVQDEMRHYNVVIDEEKCVKCGRCHSVCQNNKQVTKKHPISCNEGWSKVESIRSHSSSGGFATGIAMKFVEKNGIVCSCTFSEGKFIFSFAYTMEDVKKFTGSKYVKSNPEGIYKKIKQYLMDGKKVLFIGLPCQVAGLKLFIDQALMSNLYLIDLICHGSPSPKLVGKFFKDQGYDMTEIKHIGFRNKDDFGLTRDHEYITDPGIFDCYSLSFLNCINYTENCYECQYAQIERVSDITIGDSWGSILPERERKAGISLALCQTEKGEQLLRNSDLELFEADLTNAIKHNHQLEMPSIKPKKYDAFFDAIISGKKYTKAVRASLTRTYFNQIIKRILIKLRICRVKIRNRI